MNEMQNPQTRDGRFFNTASHIYHKIFTGQGSLTDDQRLLNEITQARKAWLQAESTFNEATDTSLIDHAIYDMMAAKTRYSYLVKTAREKGVSANTFTNLE